MHLVAEGPAQAVLPPESAAMPPPPRWRLGTRIAFRFSVVYFTLYIVATQMISSVVVVPGARVPPLSRLEPVYDAVSWIATDVLRFNTPLSTNTGSGDKPHDWALSFTLLVTAAALTLIWSAIDRRRPAYPKGHAWFRLFLRFSLAGTMVTYGMIKAFPLQMGYPSLTRLLEPYGHFSMMGVLWAQIGASPAYQIFTGLVELIAAVLLFVPGLTMLGALVAFATSLQVFTLNMTYDVPVKLFSFHLVLMSLVLLAPDAKRLLNVLVLNRRAEPSTETPLARGRRGRRIAVAAQLAFGAWLLGWSFTVNSQSYWRGPAGPRPPLYGVWIVDTMSIDGVERAPLVTDYDRWRRVIVQTATGLSFQRMDDTFLGYGAKVDTANRTISLTKGGPTPFAPAVQATPAGHLTYEQPAQDRLVLDGDVEGRKVRMVLHYFDRTNFRLVQGRFRWFQDVPFNR